MWYITLKSLHTIYQYSTLSGVTIATLNLVTCESQFQKSLSQLQKFILSILLLYNYFQNQNIY